MNMTTLPFRGDDNYKKALKVVAALRGIDTGDLVREALDRALGEELRPHINRFVANSGNNTVQDVSTVNTKAG